jgi:hypothetical protein
MAPEALVLLRNTHAPVPWVSCMTVRGDEEAVWKRESAMCQTLEVLGRKVKVKMLE